jgi:hypothetical protein
LVIAACACVGVEVASPRWAVADAGKILMRYRIGLSPFVEMVEGGRGPARRGGDTTEYLIAFNDEWVLDLTDEDLREASKATSALRAEMNAAGVLIFTGGLDDAAPLFRVNASSGTGNVAPPAATRRQPLACPSPRLPECPMVDRDPIVKRSELVFWTV